MFLLLSGLSCGIGLISWANNHNILASLLFGLGILLFLADLKGVGLNFGEGGEQ